MKITKEEIFSKLQNPPWLEPNTIFLCRHGSHAYGTNIEGSDEDIKGIFISSRDSYFGIENRIEQFELKDPDLIIFQINKFLKLASCCNPNCIEMLFGDDSNILVVNDIGQEILDNKHLFVSKEIKRTMTGYARSQLALIDRQHVEWQKVAYDSTCIYFKNEIWNDVGYNTKNALHLVRLVRMCREILTTGEVIVKRPDYKELLEIRAGLWTYEEIVRYVLSEFKDLDVLVENCKILPEVCDKEKINELCSRLVEQFLYSDYNY